MMYNVAFNLSVVFTVLSHLAVTRQRSSSPSPSSDNPNDNWDRDWEKAKAKARDRDRDRDGDNDQDNGERDKAQNKNGSFENGTKSASNSENTSTNSAHPKPKSSNRIPTSSPSKPPSLSLKSVSSSSSLSSSASAAFRRFQSNYLLVYLLAVAADWVQGPYVYALYAHYGFTKGEIARLYIAGFASSAVFGTFVASVADKYGRRSNALFYCLAYALSCMTKHSSDFRVLLLGRILGGIAYSILFSAFESWLVHEFRAHSFAPSGLGSIFARAQLGNGITAIVAGLVAGSVADRYGKVAPFDLSIVLLCILAATLAATWRENYGDQTQSVRGGMGRALRTLLSDRRIMLLGIAQAAFEGALYTFTFVWTPALQYNNDSASGTAVEIPHGLVFATFMACTMIGSNVFSLLSSTSTCCLPAACHLSTERLMSVVFCAGAALFAVTTAFNAHTPTVFTAFLAFEVLCGIYFPGMATARAPYIPEESRSALLTFFRIPLNIVVVFALYEDMHVRSVFAMCAGLMTFGALSMLWLARLAAATGPDFAEGDACEKGHAYTALNGKDGNC